MTKNSCGYLIKVLIPKSGVLRSSRFASSFTPLSTFWDSDLKLFRLNKFVSRYPKVLNSKQWNDVCKHKTILQSYLEENIDPSSYDRDGCVDPEFFRNLLKTGLFKAPVEHGGLGFNATQSALLFECLPAYDLAVAIMFGVQQSLGSYGLIHYGSDSLKATYLPQMSAGKLLGCFCLTEATAGSDISAIKTNAIYDSVNQCWILNGTKLWITNADISDLFTVFAKTTDPTSKLPTTLALLVDKKFGGIVTHPPEDMMGIRCAHSVQVTFKDTKVPNSHILGVLGEGLRIAVNSLNFGRFLLGVSMNAIMKKLLSMVFSYASTRVQFGKKLIEFEDVKFKISRISSIIYATESLARYVGGLIDMQQRPFDLESASLKIFSTEAAWFVCDEVLQIFGGRGYMAETKVEKIMRDLRIFKIIEGTNDVLRQFIYSKVLTPNKPDFLSIFHSSYLKDSKLISVLDSQIETTQLKMFIAKNYTAGIIDKENQVFGRIFVDKIIRMFVRNVMLSRLQSISCSDRLTEYALFRHFQDMEQLSLTRSPSIRLTERVRKTSKDIVNLLQSNGGNLPISEQTLII